MRKSKAARIAAFIGALGGSAALIGAAATTTGAYFTDSKTGTVSASSGHLTIDRNNDYNLSFDNLIPGEYKDRVVGYHTGGDTNEDIWLYIPAGAGYAALTGAADNSDGSPNGMGRFGHFAVKNNADQVLFSSYNLTNVSKDTSGCADDNGHGSGPQATSETDTPPNCGVPHYMLLESNVPSGTDGKFTMTFGITGKAKGQGAPVANVPFQVVATQHNIRPDAKNF